MAVERRADLDGDYSFDAISPSGDRIYLIQYLSRRDPTKYAVRAYDTAAGRMLPKPIVDRTEPDEQMHGYPMARVASPNGRWQYTLYTGSENPFVHALDTARGRARCIDLPKSVGNVAGDRLRIGPGGGAVTVQRDRRGTWVQAASIDTSSFAVSTPGSGGAAPTSGSGPSWILIVLGAGALVAVASIWGMPHLRRRRLAGSG
jgi:hypothetical protein